MLKPPYFPSTAGTIKKVIALHLGPAIPIGGGAVNTNDWCIMVYSESLTKYFTTSDNTNVVQIKPNLELHKFSLVHFELVFRAELCCCYRHPDISSAVVFYMDFNAKIEILTTCLASIKIR